MEFDGFSKYLIPASASSLINLQKFWQNFHLLFFDKDDVCYTLFSNRAFRLPINILLNWTLKKHRLFRISNFKTY